MKEVILNPDRFIERLIDQPFRPRVKVRNVKARDGLLPLNAADFAFELLRRESAKAQRKLLSNS